LYTRLVFSGRTASKASVFSGFQWSGWIRINSPIVSEIASGNKYYHSLFFQGLRSEKWGTNSDPAKRLELLEIVRAGLAETKLVPHERSPRYAMRAGTSRNAAGCWIPVNGPTPQPREAGESVLSVVTQCLEQPALDPTFGYIEPEHSGCQLSARASNFDAQRSRP